MYISEEYKDSPSNKNNDYKLFFEQDIWDFSKNSELEIRKYFINTSNIVSIHIGILVASVVYYIQDLSVVGRRTELYGIRKTFAYNRDNADHLSKPKHFHGFTLNLLSYSVH